MSENQAPIEKTAETTTEFNHVPSILSIQSHVSYGHVGSSATVFPLQRAGFEVWPAHTVNFSNHTGCDQWRGSMTPATNVRDIIEGVGRLGKLDSIDATISGYQDGSDIADVITEAVALAKRRSPKAIYSYDPVMGNAKSGCYVSDDTPPLPRDKIVPVADVITPNQFELGYLMGREVGDLGSTLATAHAAQEIDPEAVLVTSVPRSERKVGEIEMLAVNDSGAWLMVTSYLPLKRSGSGDVTATLFADNLLRDHGIDGDLSIALGNTAASIFGLLKMTHKSGSGELELVRAQEAYIHPEQQFEIAKVA